MCILNFTLGAAMFGYIVGQMATLVGDLAGRKKGGAQLSLGLTQLEHRRRMNEAKEIILQYSGDDGLWKEVKGYLEYTHEHDLFDPSQMFTSLPEAMRATVQSCRRRFTDSRKIVLRLLTSSKLLNVRECSWMTKLHPYQLETILLQMQPMQVRVFSVDICLTCSSCRLGRSSQGQNRRLSGCSFW